ncbi:hypothetical protein J6590_089025 [Homalodisca vitripennis]|nr:hypothetical protein J6590_089025 [Homalodisca vitripennis]
MVRRKSEKMAFLYINSSNEDVAVKKPRKNTPITKTAFFWILVSLQFGHPISHPHPHPWVGQKSEKIAFLYINSSIKGVQLHLGHSLDTLFGTPPPFTPISLNNDSCHFLSLTPDVQQYKKRKFSSTLTTAEIRKLVAAILNLKHLPHFCKRRSPRTPKTHHMNPSPWKNLQSFRIAENHPFSIVHRRHPRQTTNSAWQILGSDLYGGPCPMEKPYPALTTSPTRRARDAILNSSRTGGAGDTYPAANLGFVV